MQKAKVLGYKGLGRDVRFPTNTGESLVQKPKEYKLSDEELKKFRKDTKVDEKRNKQRNLNRWQGKDDQTYTVHIEWDMGTINKIINMWIDGVPLDKMAKSISKDIDDLSIVLIRLAKDDLIKHRPGGVLGES
nr:hypothetical protein 23 [Bacillales bacterium]